MSNRQRLDPWAEDEEAAAAIKRLTREEAQALSGRLRSVSPWWVVAAQAVVGLVVALVAGLVTGTWEGVGSALCGAAAVVVPGALMARGATSRLTGMSPSVSAVSFMLWESAKIMASVAMLLLAPMLVQPLNWPVLLVSLTTCISVYAFALLWRRRAV